MTATRVVVLGAGVAGLAAARELRRSGTDVTVLEASAGVAGMAGTRRDPDGFVYDTGAHFITNRLAAAVGVGHACRTVGYYGESVFVRGRTDSYPFGLARRPRYALSAVKAKAAARRGTGTTAPAVSAAESFRASYGEQLAREVIEPLLEGWSGLPADRLAASVVDKLDGVGRTLFLRAAGSVSRRAVAIGYGREKPASPGVFHVYPSDGVGTLCRGLAQELGDAVRLDHPVSAIHVDEGRVVGVRAADRDFPADVVISTAPANVLPRLAPGAPALAPFGRFRFRPMVFVNLRLRGRGLLPNVVLWTPEGRFPFFRLTEAPVSMPWLAPEGRTVVLCDIGANTDDPVWTESDDRLAERCLAALTEIVPDVRSRYEGVVVLRTTIAYPVFDLEYEADRQRLEHAGTGVDGLVSIGRNGEFGHWLMEDVYWHAVATARRLQTAAAAAAAA